MRFPAAPLSVLFGLLVAGCNPALPTEPDAPGVTASYDVVQRPDANCTLNLHAILREAASTAVLGDVQLRIDPPKAGATDATVKYKGVFGPAAGLDFEQLQAMRIALVNEAGQSTWTDYEKHDPGTTALAVLQFGRIASMSQATALALVDNAADFTAVVNVVGTTGGKEAEGVVAPTRDAPESLRDRQRICFGGS